LVHDCLFVTVADHELAAESRNQWRHSTRVISVGVSDNDLGGEYANLIEELDYSWGVSAGIDYYTISTGPGVDYITVSG
jgi:hypothetical protein